MKNRVGERQVRGVWNVGSEAGSVFGAPHLVTHEKIRGRRNLEPTMEVCDG